MNFKAFRVFGWVLIVALGVTPVLFAHGATTTVRRTPAQRRTRVIRRRTIHRYSRLRRRPAGRRRSTRRVVRRRTIRRRSAHSRYTRSRYTRRRYIRPVRYERRRVRRRTPQLSIPAERTDQIQQALISAGDLHTAPTGRWDSQTRAAMKLYQAQNGFKPTGLPDAKSLMKMGLGPHPLPPQLDPMAQTHPPAAAQNGGVADVTQP